MHFLAYDIVIFDFGLMHRILGTTECVANYLDGGYMRAGYCLQHAGALTLLLIELFKPNLPLWFLWPGREKSFKFKVKRSILNNPNRINSMLFKMVLSFFYCKLIFDLFIF